MMKLRYFFPLVLGISLSFVPFSKLLAENPQNAPSQLKSLISNLESAANQQDVDKVMSFYHTDFTTPDGLTYATLQQALEQLWQTYSTLTYNTELQTWEQQGDQWMAQTLTTLSGTGLNQGRTVQLDAQITSRQYFEDGKLVRQEILSERTDITSGESPPQVTVNLPETVRVGEEFDFDVIVKDPLGSNLLVGTAIDEPVSGDRYLNPDSFQLPLLQAGGLFKRATAPEDPQNHWLSAIIVQKDGMRLTTQRLKVEP